MNKYKIFGKEYACPLQLTLSVLMGKWKGIIVWMLLYESEVARHGEIKRGINAVAKITDKMLIQSLRELESDGLIERKVYPIVPPKVEYKLTKQGLLLKPIIDELEKFGMLYEIND